MNNKLIAAAITASLSACTPKMHRAYQIAMVSVAETAQTHAILQTHVALNNDPSVYETNFMLGKAPSAALLGGAWTVNTGIGALILALPRDRGPENDWIVSTIATVWAATTSYWAVNDTLLTNERWYR